MIIEIPSNIRGDFEGYDFVISIINKCSTLITTPIVFDFKKTTFLEANLCAILGSIFEILENNKNQISVINLTTEVEKILRKNSFLMPFGYDLLPDHYGTCLTYRKFTPNDDKSFNNYIQDELLNKKDFPSHSPRLGKEITKNIFEMYENARTHGKCDFIHTCGQFFPKSPEKPLFFTIVDKGINIRHNVSAYLNKNIRGADAIEWAMIKGNTTKTGDTSGGLGLSVIFEFITLNKGKIQVISSDGFYEYHNGIVSKKTLNWTFEGTIINIRFNLNDNNHYRLVVEDKDDFENIF
jgi:hypothetical protein